jgi:hypothetical protein
MGFIFLHVASSGILFVKEKKNECLPSNIPDEFTMLLNANALQLPHWLL